MDMIWSNLKSANRLRCHIWIDRLRGDENRQSQWEGWQNNKIIGVTGGVWTWMNLKYQIFVDFLHFLSGNPCIFVVRSLRIGLDVDWGHVDKIHPYNFVAWVSIIDQQWFSWLRIINHEGWKLALHAQLDRSWKLVGQKCGALFTPTIDLADRQKNGCPSTLRYPTLRSRATHHAG